MNDIFIVGCGYIGGKIAQKLCKHTRSIVALARSDESEARLQVSGITTWRGDLDIAQSLGGIPVAGTTLYYLAPPPPRGAIDSRLHNLLAAVTPEAPPAHIVYISTSGVYGDTGGEWVSEESPPNPQADRARRRVDAEQALRHWCEAHGVPLTLLRVAGIYGPDKLPIKRLREGSPVLREAECGYTNRIHVEDLVAICLRAGETGEGVRIYNVSDGHPGTMTAYFFAVADALGLPRPPAIGMEEAKRVLTPAMLSYLVESRRLDSSKVLRELGIRLKYSDLAAGLRDIRINQS